MKPNTWKTMESAPKDMDVEILILFDSASIDIVRLCWWNTGSSEQNGFDGDQPECEGWWTYNHSVTCQLISGMSPIGWMDFPERPLTNKAQ
jgi:hypothetical protein